MFAARPGAVLVLRNLWHHKMNSRNSSPRLLSVGLVCCSTSLSMPLASSSTVMHAPRRLSLAPRRPSVALRLFVYFSAVYTTPRHNSLDIRQASSPSANYASAQFHTTQEPKRARRKRNGGQMSRLEARCPPWSSSAHPARLGRLGWRARMPAVRLFILVYVNSPSWSVDHPSLSV